MTARAREAGVAGLAGQSDRLPRNATMRTDENHGPSPTTNTGEPVAGRSEALALELAASLRDLQEVVEADPLNPELQRARYDVFLALCSCRAAGTRQRVRPGVYFARMAGATDHVKRKRGGGAAAADPCEVVDAGSMADTGDRINAMNPKNMYSRRRYAPDFLKLANLYPVLSQHLAPGRGETPTTSYNFKSWEACRDLAAVLFEHDFGVRSWTIPKPHLVPPLPNRLNYLCYIHDLLEADGRTMGSLSVDASPIRILDVGCGANLVYPLLAAAYFGWGSVGCDINEAALRHAAGLRDANPAIAPLMVLRHTAGLRVLEDETVDAMVCNPPFFDSDAGEPAGRNPRTDYGGTEAEMWCAGGEEAFVVGMIRDSKLYKDRCTWFSSMCGKKKTLKDARAELARLAEEGREKEVTEDCGAGSGVTHRVCILEQGSTTRWVIAWRFN